MTTPDDAQTASADETDLTELARAVVQTLSAKGLTVATAESLTAGGVAATIADIPGASAVLNGGVVSYTDDVKHRLLGVDQHLLDTRGAVDELTATQMAVGVQRAARADIGVSTTGVAGPEPHQGKDVGTVYIGIAGAEASATLHRFDGDRATIRQASIRAALQAVLDMGELLSPSESHQ